MYNCEICGAKYSDEKEAKYCSEACKRMVEIYMEVNSLNYDDALSKFMQEIL